MSWQWRMIQKLNRNWLVVFKLTWGTLDPSTQKKLCFNWLLVTKVYNVWAMKVQRTYLSWHWRVMQIWRKIDSRFEKWHDKFGQFSPKHLKVSKLGLWWDPFVQSRKGMVLKFAEELCVMTINNNAKFE